MSKLLAHYSSRRVAFFCCDIQTAFAQRVPNFNHLTFVANRFAALHNLLPPTSTKYVVTEQYPKGLGRTVPEIAVPPTAIVAEKTKFSMVVPGPVRDALEHVDDVVIFGLEAHVCVLHTVDDLCQLGKRVFIARDGVASQSNEDRDAALDLMRSYPAVTVSTSESLLLQMVRDAKDPLFKEVSSLLKLKP